MTYKYYKFPNKNLVPKIWPEGVSVSEVGLIKKINPVYDDHGNIIEPPQYHDGWHVNVCYRDNVNLDFLNEYEITVNNPKQKWFGQ
jgi:hypothetical protein